MSLSREELDDHQSQQTWVRCRGRVLINFEVKELAGGEPGDVTSDDAGANFGGFVRSD